jgi:uncharacterized protein YndB with AHSA1/START domain
MPACEIKDSIRIRAASARVFRALTDGAELARWWPKAARSEARLGGRLVLSWFDGGEMSTAFSEWEPDRAVGYPFYDEHLRFELHERGEDTELVIAHRCGHDASIHIAQSWGFLKANLKSVIETGRDLRAGVAGQ